MKNKHHNMHPAGRRVVASERKPPKRRTEQMPFKWMLLIPAIVLVGLWSGYHFTHSSGGSATIATPTQTAANAGSGAEAGTSAPPSPKDAPSA